MIEEKIRRLENTGSCGSKYSRKYSKLQSKDEKLLTKQKVFNRSKTKSEQKINIKLKKEKLSKTKRKNDSSQQFLPFF